MSAIIIGMSPNLDTWVPEGQAEHFSCMQVTDWGSAAGARKRLLEKKARIKQPVRVACSMRISASRDQQTLHLGLGISIRKHRALKFRPKNVFRVSPRGKLLTLVQDSRVLCVHCILSIVRAVLDEIGSKLGTRDSYRRGEHVFPLGGRD